MTSRSAQRLLIVCALAGSACGDGSDDATANSDVTAPDSVGGTDVAVDSASDGVAGADAGATDVQTTPDVSNVHTARAMALCEPLAQATCRVFVGCRVGAAPASVQQCEGHVRSVCEAAAPTTAARLQAGLVTLDDQAADSCFVQATFATCAPLDTLLAGLDTACGAVFTGAVAIDQPCSHAGDCAAGLVCSPGPGGTCPGTCQAPGGAASACNTLTPCDADHLCDAGVCIPKTVTLAQPCALSEQCPSGMFCDDAAAACAPTRGEAGACDADDACDDGLYCAFIEGADAGACATRLAAGATCLPFDGGEPCVAGYACDMETSICVPLPDGPGDACVETWRPCVSAGLYCDFAASTCRVEPRLGELCGGLSLPTRCQFGWCTGSPASTTSVGTCEPFAAPGASCSDSRECGSLACTAGTCQPRSERACHPRNRDLDMGLSISLLAR